MEKLTFILTALGCVFTGVVFVFSLLNRRERSMIFNLFFFAVFLCSLGCFLPNLDRHLNAQESKYSDLLEDVSRVKYDFIIIDNELKMVTRTVHEKGITEIVIGPVPVIPTVYETCDYTIQAIK